MHTNCYCIYCPKHPKHKRRSKIDCPTGFSAGDFPPDKAAGAEVDCLEPVSDAFIEFDIDPEDEEFPVTAYGDGCSITGFARDGIVLTATCGSEGYEH